MQPEQMKAIRARLGLTQTEIAKVICVAKNTVSCYERGTLSPAPTVQMVYEELHAGWKPVRLLIILRGRKVK